MKASELIANLQAMVEQYGDRRVVIWDEVHGWVDVEVETDTIPVSYDVRPYEYEPALVVTPP